MIKNLHSSLIKFAQTQILVAETAGISNDIDFINLDAFADITEVPSKDLIGLSTFTCDVSDKIHSVNCSFGVMAYQDPNLFRHYELLDQLYRALQPENKLPLYLAGSLTKIGWLVVVDGTSLLPIMRSETRSLQFVQASMLASPA